MIAYGEIAVSGENIIDARDFFTYHEGIVSLFYFDVIHLKILLI